ncbi:MAG: hypothetical protein N2491_11750 [Negativicutes bacterium]|nr:hypothetical protein [Negativicutes bacterium]
MLTATEYLGSIGIGVTSPRLFRADDGHIYVVKLQHNRLGPKVLANEYIAAKLGEELKLCFPASDLIRLEADVILKSPKLVRAGLQPGIHFACRYLSHSAYVDRRKLAKAVNKEQLAGVMLLDHLLHNVDRTWNRKNLIIRREEEGAKIYAIDNSHLFVRGRWTAETLRQLADRIIINHRRSYGILLKYYLKPADFVPYLAAVSRLSDQYISELVASIPGEWLPLAAERQALISYLSRRRELAAAICSQLCSLIPDIDGSSQNDQVE